MGTAKSLVLVTVDCLRADHVGFMGYKRPTTPFLDSLARESFVFPAAIVAGAPTYYSFPAIFASRYPLSLGRDVLGVAPKEPTLAAVLQSQGYATAGFVAANPYVSARFGYEQGFDVFKDFLSGQLSPLVDEAGTINSSKSWLSRLNRTLEQSSRSFGPLGAVYDELYFQYCQRLGSSQPQSLEELRRFPAADVMVNEAMNWLSALHGERFFLWIHLMDPHSPYYPTTDALGLMGRSDITPFRARYLNSAWNRSHLTPRRFQRYRRDIVELYDAGVRWVDLQLAQLVDFLKESGQWGECAFAVTGDHGEEFLEHGGRYHPPSRLIEVLIHVPLLVRIPGAPKRDLADSPFSLLHLAPTLLDAMGCVSLPEFCGHSLWTQVKQGRGWEDAAIAECVSGCTNPFLVRNRLGGRVLVVRERRYKLHLTFDPPSEKLFDLLHDPDEKSPLPPEVEKTTRRRLLERARAHVQLGVQQRESQMRLEMQLRDLRLEWDNRHATTPALTTWDGSGN